MIAVKRAAQREREALANSSHESDEDQASMFGWTERLDDGLTHSDLRSHDSFDFELDLSAQTAMQLLLSELPDEKSCLLKGQLLKLNQSFDWKPFEVAISSDHLLFARQGTKFVFDSVPLLDIIHIEGNLDESHIPDFVDHLQAESTRPEENQGMLQNPGAWRALKQQASNKALGTCRKVPCFEVRTCDGGYNSGRSYYLKPESEEALTKWVAALNAGVRAAIARKAAERGWLRRRQGEALGLYQSDAFQGGVALLIAANFVVNVAQTEIQPADGSLAAARFADADSSFTGPSLPARPRRPAGPRSGRSHDAPQL